MRTCVMLLVLVAVSACPSAPGEIGKTCDNTFDCVDNAVCVLHVCRRVCNDSRECASDQRCTNGACLPGQPGADGGLPDGGGDAALVDAARRDLAGFDLRSRDLRTGADTPLPDTTPFDTSGCVAQYNQPCARNGYCGATIDCVGACGGGTTAPACPTCGSRTCQNLTTWSPCQNGTCGANSQCNADGNCVCTVDDCSGSSVCRDGDVWSCTEDAYQCGAYGSRTADCTAPEECGGSPPGCHSNCVPNYGQDCWVGGYCGMKIDCAGNCNGGNNNPPACPTCGSRTCDGSNNRSGCQGGSCGANSSCNANGYCVCDVNECSGSQCSGGDWYTCNVDAYGCGKLVFNADCSGTDPCLIYSCSGGCQVSSKCGAGQTCSAGNCCSNNEGQVCATCSCAPPYCSTPQTVDRGYYDCSGDCVFDAICNNCNNCCANICG